MAEIYTDRVSLEYIGVPLAAPSLASRLTTVSLDLSEAI